MARPAQGDPSATRGRILDRAAGLFAEAGREGASTRAIAAAAGVSLATVHHHFGGKDALYAACVDAMFRELWVLASDLAVELQRGGPRSLPDHVEAIVRRTFRFVCARRPIVRLVTRDAIDRGEVDAASREAHMLPLLGQAAQLVALATGQPEATVRLALRSVTVLAVRYALTAPREIALVLGRPPPEDAAAEASLLRALEDHLVDAARALLGIPAPAPSKTATEGTESGE